MMYSLIVTDILKDIPIAVTTEALKKATDIQVSSFKGTMQCLLGSSFIKSACISAYTAPNIYPGPVFLYYK